MSGKDDKVDVSINNNSNRSLSIEKLDKTYKEIQDLYLSDNRPWIIGYSGGKDSSATVQLVWNALYKLDINKRNKTVHVITTDTLVENPVIAAYTRTVLSLIDEEAQKENIPLKTHIIYPKIEESFWVNLIGKGYPAPQQRFRWCTDKLKIKPSNRFIIEQVNRYGEVIIVLGIRENESMTRNQVMSLHKINGANNILYKHSSLPSAYVYAPIRNWSLEEVWSFLIDYNSVSYPWSYINKELTILYKKAVDPLSMECPLVIDNTTPSCGNSRFGCWVCTVVKQDKSMQSLIEHGEEWMKPLYNIRNLLSTTQDPKIKPLVREYKRRNGCVVFKDDNKTIVYGPYKLEFCKEILRMVLKAQEELKSHNNIGIKYIELIREEELHIIRRIWKERGDWEDSLPKIYKDVTGREFSYIDDDISIGTYDSSILSDIANKYGLPVELLKKIINTEIQTYNSSKRTQIYNTLDKILSEEWRTLDEIKNSYGKHKEA